MFNLVALATALAGAALPVVPQDQRQWGQESSCGTTSLSSICEFYRPGEPAGNRRRLDRYLMNGDIGTAPDELARWAMRHGYRAAIKTRTALAEIAALIDRGVPVQALIDRGSGADGNLHYVVVAGYEAGPDGTVAYLALADSMERGIVRIPAADFESQWSDLELWSVPLGIDRLIVSYVPEDRSDVPLPGNRWDPFDESQPARVAGKAFMNLANGWARSDPARFAGGLVQGAGSTVGFALLFPGQALQVLGGPAEDLGILLAGSGALASWGTAQLGDTFRLFEIAPD